MDSINRFLGGSLLGVAFRLIVMSLLVGMLLSWMNWTPRDVWYWFEDTVVAIWEQGFAFFGAAGEWVAVGAFVVVPVFLVLRVLKWRAPRTLPPRRPGDID